MRPYSIRTLMVFVVAAAVGLTALRNANAWWAGAMLLIAIAAVGIAITGAVMMRGGERCWWAAFAFFGGSYLTLTFAPGFSTEVGPKLATTTVLDSVYSQFIASSGQKHLPQYLWWQHARALDEVDRPKAANRGPSDRELESAMNVLANLESQLQGAADERDFIRVGHGLFALLAGLVGGSVAGWFRRRRERAEAAAATA